MAVAVHEAVASVPFSSCCHTAWPVVAKTAAFLCSQNSPSVATWLPRRPCRRRLNARAVDSDVARTQCHHCMAAWQVVDEVTNVPAAQPCCARRRRGTRNPAIRSVSRAHAPWRADRASSDGRNPWQPPCQGQGLAKRDGTWQTLLLVLARDRSRGTAERHLCF